MTNEKKKKEAKQRDTEKKIWPHKQELGKSGSVTGRNQEPRHKLDSKS